MNLDKITVDDMMEFLGIEERTRDTPEVRATVQKFINMKLPTIADTSEFIQFYNERYGDKDD